MNIDYDQLENEYLFSLSKMDILQECLVTPFPGTEKWPADHPIWDCYVAGCMSPKEAWNNEEMLLKAINNLFYITIKSINENKYEDFVSRIQAAFYSNDIRLMREVLGRFTIAKIAPKVTALMPSAFERILEETNIDISSGIYCPMAGFGGIVEGAKRYYKKHSIEADVEAYDINPSFCKYYGWVQKDLLVENTKTDKVVFVCPPFGTNTERWPDTPMERNDEYKTNYLDFHDWCKVIKEKITAPNYIFVGPELGNKRREQNPNITSGLFSKKYGIQWYPEYSIKEN